jgi:mercuric reductase
MSPLDLVVVGSGGAAMAAGIQARSQGGSVALVEGATVGGTCLNVGCVPSKTLLAASAASERARHPRFPGVPSTAGVVDLAALIRHKDDLVSHLRGAKYLAVAEAHGFEIIHGHARFAGPDLLLVDDVALPAKAYLLATGAVPCIDGLAGLDGVAHLTSTTAMELTRLPQSLLVIGAGDVGMEQAQLFAGLGTSVTLLGRLAPRAEPELAQVMRQAFVRSGIHIIEERAATVTTQGHGVAVTTEDGTVLQAKHLLVATGRVPRHEGLDLGAAGIDVNARGFIAIDDHQLTSNPKVWAAGDVSATPQHVYAAAATGRVAASNALGGDASVDWRGLPAVTFTRPQLATVGLTEQQAVDGGYGCECRLLPAADLPRALADHDPLGVVKIVAETSTGRILGVHAALEGAGELMLAATYAIRNSMTVDDVAGTWAPYLTTGEALRLCATLFRSEKPMSCCA